MPDIASYHPDQTFVVIDTYSNQTHEIALRIVSLSYKLKRLHSPWGVFSPSLQSDELDDSEVLLSNIQEGMIEGLSKYVELRYYQTKKKVVAMPIFKYSLLKAYNFLTLISICVCCPGIWHYISMYENEEKTKGRKLLNELKIVKPSTYVLSFFLIYATKFLLIQIIFWLPIFLYNSKFLDLPRFIASVTLLSLNLSAFSLAVCSTFRQITASAIVVFGTLFACSISSFVCNDSLPDSKLSYVMTILFPIAYQFYLRITANSIMSDMFREMSSTSSTVLIVVLVLDCLMMLTWAMFRENSFSRRKKSTGHRLKISSNYVSDTRTPLMKLSDVTVCKKQGKVLSDINLSLYKNEVTAFHGAGSQELLQTIRGDLVNNGSIYVFDEGLLNESKVISSFDELRMLPYLNVMEHTELLINIRQAINIDLYQMMDDLGILGVGHLFYDDLNTNEKHLLNLMFAFLSNAAIVLLHEPFNCDTLIHPQLCRFLRKQKKDRAVVFSCNNLAIPNKIADSIVFLANGEVWRQLSFPEFRKETHVLILWSRQHFDAARISAIKKKVCACLGSKFKGRLLSCRQPRGALTFRAGSISLIKYSKLLKYLEVEFDLGIDKCELKLSTPIDDYIRFCNIDTDVPSHNHSFVKKLSNHALCTVFPDIPTIIDRKIEFFSKNGFATFFSFFLPISLSILVSILNKRSPLNTGQIDIKAYMENNEKKFFSVNDKENKSLSTHSSNCSYLTEHLQYDFGAVRRENTTYLCYYANSVFSELFLNQLWFSEFYKDMKVNVTIETIYSQNWRFLINSFSHYSNLGTIPLPVVSIAVSDNWLEVLTVGIIFLLCISHIPMSTREVFHYTKIKDKKQLRFWITNSLVDYLVFLVLTMLCTFLVVFPHNGVFVSLLTISSSSIAFMSSLPFIYMISSKSNDSLSACLFSFHILGGFLLPVICSLFGSSFESQFEASISLIFSLTTLFPPIVPSLITGIGAYYKLQQRGSLYILKQLSPLYLISFMPMWTWVFTVVMNKEILPKIRDVVKSIQSKFSNFIQKSRIRVPP